MRSRPDGGGSLGSTLPRAEQQRPNPWTPDRPVPDVTPEEKHMATLTVWKFPTAEGAQYAVATLRDLQRQELIQVQDRKSTRLNSSHSNISYAVFCLKKKKLTRA